MNIDLEQMAADLAEVSADALLRKDLSKYKKKIDDNIALVEKYLAEYDKERTGPLNQDVLKMGYYFYEFRNQCNNR